MDVANLAGVSKKTVSRVLNREPNVKQETRDRVVSAVRGLNYSPNISARRLAKSRSFILALAYEDRDANHYIPDIQHGVLERCREHNYHLLLHPCGEDHTRLPAEIQELSQQALIDGLILMPPLSDSRDLVLDIRRTEVPFVRLSQLHRDQYSPCVSVNDEEAVAEMTKYLIGLGHRDIGFVVGHPDHGSSADRLRGFQSAMADANLVCNEAWIYQGDYTFESGVAAGKAIIDLESGPSAVFASNDDMAAGVLKTAHRMGCKVPAQLSVVGFDDIAMAARLWPPLTTVRQPVREAAATATEVLLRQLAGDETVPQSTQLEARLIIRESTGPCPRRP